VSPDKCHRGTSAANRRLQLMLGLLLCPMLATAEPMTWKLLGDIDPSVLSSRTDLEACLHGVMDKLRSDRDLATMIGVYVDTNGVPVSVSILESSGVPALDHRLASCLRHSRFKARDTKVARTPALVFRFAVSSRPPKDSESSAGN
jgi:hypothetical protein